MYFFHYTRSPPALQREQTGDILYPISYIIVRTGKGDRDPLSPRCYSTDDTPFSIQS